MSFRETWDAVKEMERIVLLDTETEREHSQWELYSPNRYMRDRISEAYSTYLRWEGRGQAGSVILHPTPWESFAEDIARCITPSAMATQQLAAFLVVYGQLFGWSKSEHMNIAVQELFDHLPGGRGFSTYGLAQSYEGHMRERLLVVPLGHKLVLAPREFGNGSQWAICSLAQELGAVGYADEGEGEKPFPKSYGFYFKSYADYVRATDILVDKRLERERLWQEAGHKR